MATNPLDRFKDIINRRSATSGPAHIEPNPFDTEDQHETQLAYDPSQRQILEPEITSLGLTLPEDPNSPEFQALVEHLKGSNRDLAFQVQGMVYPADIRPDDKFMNDAKRRARNASAFREKWNDTVMVENNQGELVPNKMIIVGAALAVLGLAWVAVANSGGARTAPATTATDPANPGAPVGIRSADGSITTKLPNGDIRVVHPDGSSEVTKLNGDVTKTAQDGTVTTLTKAGTKLVTSPNGASVQTLADGSVITRDPLGNILSNTPPTSIGSGQVNTSDLIQNGKALAASQPTTIQHDPTVTQAPIGSTPAGQSGLSTATTPPVPTTASSDLGASTIGDPTAQPATQTYDPNQTYTPTGVSNQPISSDQGASTASISSPAEASPAGMTPGTTGLTGGTASVAPAMSGGQATLAPEQYTPTATTVSATTRPVYTTPAGTTAGYGQAQTSPAGSAPAGALTDRNGTVNVAASQPTAQRPVQTLAVMKTAASTPAGSTANTGGAVQYAYHKVSDEKTGMVYSQAAGQPAQATSPASNTSSGNTSSTAAQNATGAQDGAQAAAPAPSGAGSSVQYLRSGASPTLTRIVPAPPPAVPTSDTATGTPGQTANGPSSPAGTTGAGYGSLPASSYLNTVPPGSTPAAAAGFPATALPATVASPYRIGQRMNAVMDTTIIATETGQDLPAYAHTADGTVWIGKTTMNATKRININFTRAVLKDGNMVSLNASAYGLDGAPGVEGKFQTLAPTLFNDLIRAGVSGVREYVDAKIQATTTTTNNSGAQTVERQAPTIWESVAGSTAKVFTLPPTTTTFVPVSTLQSGAPLVIINNPIDSNQ